MEMETETVTEPVKPDFIALEKAVVAPHADPGLAERLKDAMYYWTTAWPAGRPNFIKRLCSSIKSSVLACTGTPLF